MLVLGIVKAGTGLPGVRLGKMSIGFHGGGLRYEYFNQETGQMGQIRFLGCIL